MINIVRSKYPLVILLLLIGLLAVSYFTLRQRQDIRKRAVEPALEIAVGADPPYKIVAQNQSFTVKLDMKNTSLNTKVISGAQANIDIDVSRYTIESVTCGDDFAQGFAFISTPLPTNGIGINIYCAIQPDSTGLIIGNGTFKTLAKISLKVKEGVFLPDDPSLNAPPAVKINSVRVTQVGEPASGNAYNFGRKGEDAFFSIVATGSNAIGAYPSSANPAADNKCSYYVSWILATGVNGKVTFQHSGEPIVNWCPTTTGTNPCATWTLPVSAQTPVGKTTTFRLYNESQPTVVLDTAVFTCTGIAATPTATQVPATPTITQPASCDKKPTGDANCDGNINGRDYSVWLRSQCSRSCLDKRADFNNDTKVDEIDRQIWIDNRS